MAKFFRWGCGLVGRTESDLLRNWRGVRQPGIKITEKKEMQKSFRSCGSCSILFNIYDPVLVFSINHPTNPQSALSALILCESEAWTNERIHRFCGFDFHTVTIDFGFFVVASTRVEWTVKQVVVVIFMCAGFLRWLPVLSTGGLKWNLLQK